MKSSSQQLGRRYLVDTPKGKDEIEGFGGGGLV